MSATCEEGLGAARPYSIDTASQYVTADKPEATFTTSPEINPNLSTASQTAPSHNIVTKTPLSSSFLDLIDLNSEHSLSLSLINFGGYSLKRNTESPKLKQLV